MATQATTNNTHWIYTGPEIDISFEDQYVSADDSLSQDIPADLMPTSKMIEKFRLTCEEMGLLKEVVI